MLEVKLFEPRNLTTLVVSYSGGTNNFLINFKNILINKCSLLSISNPKYNNGTYQLTFMCQNDVKNISKSLYKDSDIFMKRKKI
jgi:hypothetical protein